MTGKLLAYHLKSPRVPLVVRVPQFENHYIRGLPLKLFENYLANRTHFVSIEDIQSQKASVTCGVLQGSNLGPLFFLLYVNDITHVSKFKTILLADDTVLPFSAKSVIDLKNKG